MTPAPIRFRTKPSARLEETAEYHGSSSGESWNGALAKLLVSCTRHGGKMMVDPAKNNIHKGEQK